MKQIKLSQGQFALVDDDDFELLNQYNWFANKHRNTFYARRNIRLSPTKRTAIQMHRVIVDCPVEKMIDHIDGNGLNNQKNNLRIVSNRQNAQNLHISRRSIYPGVHWHNIGHKWQARIWLNGKAKHIGLYPTEIEAFRAYYDAVLSIGEKIIDFEYPILEGGI